MTDKVILPADQEIWICKSILDLQAVASKTTHLFAENIYNVIRGDYPLSSLKMDVWDSIESGGLSYDSATRVMNDLETIRMLAEQREYFELCSILKDISHFIMDGE